MNIGDVFLILYFSHRVGTTFRETSHCLDSIKASCINHWILSTEPCGALILCSPIIILGTLLKSSVSWCMVGQTVESSVPWCMVGQTVESSVPWCMVGQTVESSVPWCMVGQTVESSVPWCIVGQTLMATQTKTTQTSEL